MSVASNPTQRGTADLSINAITDSNGDAAILCSDVNSLGGWIFSINTPVSAIVSDTAGAPVMIENASVEETYGIAGTGDISSCTANVNLSGTADYPQNAFNFPNQVVNLTGCPTTPFSAQTPLSFSLSISSIFDQTAGAYVYVSGPEVLTTGSMGGSDVAVGDTFSSNASVSGSTLSCTSGSANGSVVENDLTQGTGEYLVSGLTLSSCTALGFPATVTVINLPYPLTVADSSGFPATLIGLYATVSADGLTCTYSGSPNGSVQLNGGISFPNETFGLNTGSAGCPGLVTASLTLAQPTDTSVLGNPHIYTN
jgi:hypothetical protein